MKTGHAAAVSAPCSKVKVNCQLTASSWLCPERLAPWLCVGWGPSSHCPTDPEVSLAASRCSTRAPLSPPLEPGGRPVLAFLCVRKPGQPAAPTRGHASCGWVLLLQGAGALSTGAGLSCPGVFCNLSSPHLSTISLWNCCQTRLGLMVHHLCSSVHYFQLFLLLLHFMQCSVFPRVPGVVPVRPPPLLTHVTDALRRLGTFPGMRQELGLLGQPSNEPPGGDRLT